MASSSTTPSTQPVTEGHPTSRVSSGFASFWRQLGKFLLSGWALIFFVFLYLPIVTLIVFSFNESRFATEWSGFTLQWYGELFQNRLLGLALRNSLIVAFSTTLISTAIGTMVAVALERFDFKGKLPIDALLFLPIIIPDIAMGIMLLSFFALLNQSLGFVTIIIAHTAFNISFVAVIVRARMADIDPTLEEAANDLGANEWQAFWRVGFPLLLPGILAGALTAFTLSLDDYVVTFFVSGPGSTTLPVRVYGMIRRGVTPEINALSSLLLVASMILVVLSLALQRRSSRLNV
ncbi:MAG: ABC transporter permease [Chloroflexi bacterium]|nr:ABC transporter permease [Chloroflexota bacterium]